MLARVRQRFKIVAGRHPFIGHHHVFITVALALCFLVIDDDLREETRTMIINKRYQVFLIKAIDLRQEMKGLFSRQRRFFDSTRALSLQWRERKSV